MSKKSKRLLSCIAGSIICLPTVALAQSGNQLALEEVTVTARKRTENLQDVPISITALDSDALRASGTNSLGDLYASVPNFEYSDSGFSTFSQVVIRGVISSDSLAGFETATGTVVDDVYVGRSAAYNTALLDVERIEILRGPQGTLQGKNITGGVINITTRRPTERFTGGAELSMGSLSLRQFRGYVSGPLSEGKVAGKLSGMIRKRDGSVEDIATGNTLGNSDNQSVAGQLLFTPNDSLEVLVGADYSKDDIYDNSTMYTAPGEVTRLLTPTVRSRKLSMDFDGQTERKVFGTFARVEYTAPSGLTFTSVSSYRGFDVDGFFEQDGTLSRLVNTGKVQEQRQYSQEFRLSSATDGPFDWLGGLYYFNEKIDEQTRGAFFAFGVDTIALATVEGESIAGFGSLNFDVGDRSNASVGLRYTSDKRDFKGAAGYLGLAPAGIAPCAPPAGQPFCPFTGTSQIKVPLPIPPSSLSDGTMTGDLTFNHRWTPAISTYVKYARGYKGGGFVTNLASTSLGDPVDPEYVDSFEIGYRSMLMDGRVRLNATAFYLDWKDRQVVDFDPVRVANVARNDKKATSSGAEFELNAQLSEAFSLDLNAALLDATIKEGFVTKPGIGQVSLNGKDTPYSPGASYGGALQFRRPASDRITVFARGEVNWRDSFYLNSENTFKAPSTTLLNARIGVESSDGRYSLALWGKNLTDEDVVSSAGSVPLPPPNGPKLFVVLRDPRTYGVTFNARF